MPRRENGFSLRVKQIILAHLAVIDVILLKRFFVYREELKRMENCGLLKLFTAFSRDQEQKM